MVLGHVIWPVARMMIAVVGLQPVTAPTFHPIPAMKRLFVFVILFALGLAAHAEPLRVFIRAGKKSHGPNQHEHERFLADWKVLLTERGMKADGALNWPTAEQFKTPT